MDRTAVKYHNGYLQLFMPNGELIPQQVSMIIENSAPDKKTATVTITLISDISQIGETMNNEADYREEIKILEERLYQSHKSALFWEKLHNKEKSLRWYQKLFNF